MKKVISLLIFLFNFIYPLEMREYFKDLFGQDPVSTESRVYQLLKTSKSPINSLYLAVPWAYLINNRMLNDMPMKYLGDGFTVCQHIHYDLIIPILEKIGITTLFTPHAGKTDSIGKVKIVPFQHFAVNGIEPAQEKDIWYSFIGFSGTHWTRKKIFGMEHPSNSYIVERKNWHFSNNAQVIAQEKKEYQDTLARSRYALCPRGTGGGTIRFWECLWAGAVPVLFADDLDLPKGIDWDAAIIRVPEKEVLHFRDYITHISQEQEAQMRENCLNIYQEYCQGKNFIRWIEEYFQNDL